MSSLFIIHFAYRQSAHQQIEANLDVAKRVFEQLIDAEALRLSESAFFLASDFSFKSVIATQDRKTILSALENLQGRIGADSVMLVSPQLKLRADTSHPRQTGEFFAPDVIQQAQIHGQSSSIVLLEGRPYQMVIVPILAPDVISWLCVNFKISEMLVEELQQLTRTDISLLQIWNPDQLALLTSTLTPRQSEALIKHFQGVAWHDSGSHALQLGKHSFISSVVDIASNDQVSIVAVLQRSLDQELEPFTRLQWLLLGVASVSLLFAMVGSLLVARSVSKPVKQLLSGVRQVARGQYDYRIAVRSADELGELGHAFNDMTLSKAQQEALRQAKESAESASQAKSEFLANMSHELRTPLNSILGYAQLLKRTELSPDEQLKSLHTIEQSGQHLLTLINEILDLSKIEAGQFQLLPVVFNLRQLLKTVEDTIYSHARNKQLQLVCEFADSTRVSVHSDQQRLSQILINLLDNAVKYTEEGRVVFIVESVNNRFRFMIEDTGIGIDQHDLESIFASFQQLHNPAQGFVEGTGLGLAISQRLVALLGGDLQVSSEPGCGSRFWFDLNLPVQAQESGEMASEASHNIVIALRGKQRKVLIADDKPDNRRLLIDWLQRFELELYEAENGRQCIDQILKLKPDLVLLDSKMPEMDGLDVSRAIRTNPELNSIAIIAVSANAFDEHRQRCLAAGANNFLAKPIQFDQLLHMIVLYTDLQPVYESDVNHSDVGPVNKDMQDVLPSTEQLQALLVCAQRGDIQAIRDQLHEFESTQLSRSEFILKLTTCAENFQINRICQILEHTLNTQENANERSESE
ncbi:MAG: response regulator [Gammaproteobacteria bacterium]|nr:response regulator [Gammaproteobacteria bacterium]